MKSYGFVFVGIVVAAFVGCEKRDPRQEKATVPTATETPSAATSTAPSASTSTSRKHREGVVEASDDPTAGRLGSFSSKWIAADPPADFLGAAKVCRANGLRLCTEGQWDAACRTDATIGSKGSWTASYDEDAQLPVSRGGGQCSTRKATGWATPVGHGAYCCSASPIVVPPFKKSEADAVGAAIRDLEDALNAGHLDKLDDVLAPTVTHFYSLKNVAREAVIKQFAAVIAKSPDMWIAHDRCTLTPDDAGLQVDCRKTAYAAGKVGVILSRYHLTADGKVDQIVDIKTIRPISEPSQPTTGQLRDVAIVTLGDEPPPSVDANVGDRVAITLPGYIGYNKWTYASVDGALGRAQEEVVPRWLGPGTPGLKFTFGTAGVSPGDHVVRFSSTSPPARQVEKTESGESVTTVKPLPPLSTTVTIHLKK